MDWAGFWAWVTSDPLSATLYGLAALVVIVGIIIFLFVRRKKKTKDISEEQRQIINKACTALDQQMNDLRDAGAFVSEERVRIKEGVEIACPNCGERLVWTEKE